MIALTAADVAAVTGGRLHGVEPRQVVHGPVVVDAARAEPGAVFVALAGPGEAERATRAVAGGAALVVATHPVTGPDGAPAACVVVDDAARALLDLAREVLLRVRTDDETGATRLTVVGVTGSVGRPAALALLAHVLTPSAPTVTPVEPAGTVPDHGVALALTVLHADEDTRFLLLDLGPHGPGDALDPALAPPDVAVVVGLGSARPEDAAATQAPARHAAGVVAGLASGGRAVLTADVAVVAALAGSAPGDVTTFGTTAGADVRGTDVVVDRAGRPSFTLRSGDRSAHVALRIVGADHVHEALAAAAVAVHVGIDLDEVAGLLSAAGSLSPHRMHVVDRADGVTVIDDSADAEPESMRAALKTLAVVAGRDRRSVAVLGEMRDVGPHHRDAHEAIGLMVVRLNVGLTVVVGAGAQPIADGALREGSWGDEVAVVDDVDAAAAFLAGELAAGDVVLVKGSADAGLSRLGDLLVAAELGTDDRAAEDRAADAPPTGAHR